ncbi:hypothetical protein SDRG_14826 [Saprolegnia diclina VS20]|uniref:Uncharacterized protein n=1 Tax=Saprolegnia diclina (strain VS20) TaxID=1156394 RepID=T0Q1X9_SAPDV|nr:hypothetical protein SDRG_14826 [Saprolegnia diclina VS20]EQC27385.1 hypothetical protein SDRG_14826 [Saprolegnia diclina VS20]|eukprot:XP_008619204.1 hypothetical protein SDRG_14826 [Saprolegnia diclina VS20]
MTTETEQHHAPHAKCRDRLRTLCILALFGLTAVLAITLFDASSHAEPYTAPPAMFNASACSACATDADFCSKKYFAGATSKMQACPTPTTADPCCCPTSARRSDGTKFAGACWPTSLDATCLCSFTPAESTNHGTFNSSVVRYVVVAAMAALVLMICVLACVDRRTTKRPPAADVNAEAAAV